MLRRYAPSGSLVHGCPGASRDEVYPFAGLHRPHEDDQRIDQTKGSALMPCKNVGGIDRALRLVLGVVLLGSGLALLAAGGGHGWTLTIVGALVLASGVLGFCPPYVLLGISTARPGSSAAGGAPEKAAGAR
jgi:DUF2892 family protein